MQVFASSLFSGVLIQAASSTESVATATSTETASSNPAAAPEALAGLIEVTPPLTSSLWQPIPMFRWDGNYLRDQVRPEAPERQAEVLNHFLGDFRGDPFRLMRVSRFLDKDDWQKIPYRHLQTLKEVLGIAAASEAVYSRLGINLEETFHFAYGYCAPDVSMIRKETIQAPFNLELWPGLGEAHGGLDLRITTRGQLVAKVGFFVGPETIHIVQIKGGPAFQPNQRELNQVLGKMHPFDRLLQSLRSYALAAGYKRLRGYGYSHNPWIQKDFADGLFPPERRAHFRKVYDDRFLAFGMTRLDDPADVFEVRL